MYRIAFLIMALSATLILPGCGNRMWESVQKGAKDSYEFAFDSSPTTRSYHDLESVPIIELNHEAADVLYKNVGTYEIPKKSPVYVTTFTNQNDPNDTAIFGKVVTQQVVDRLVQRGIVIREGEPKVSDYFMDAEVDPKKYESPTKAMMEKLPPRAAMLTGHYVIGDSYIYMSAKAYRLDDKAVITAHNWTLPINDNVRQLLPQLLKSEEGLDPTVKGKF